MPQNEFNLKLMEEFRANGGKVKGRFDGFPVVILTTTGAKSGQQLSTPLVYTKDGDDQYVIIASMGGAPKHPAWYHNIVANPGVTLEVGTEKFDATAEVVESPDRERLYAAQAAMMPAFNDYEKNTTRRIPVIRMTRKR